MNNTKVEVISVTARLYNTKTIDNPVRYMLCLVKMTPRVLRDVNTTQAIYMIGQHCIFLLRSVPERIGVLRTIEGFLVMVSNLSLIFIVVERLTQETHKHQRNGDGPKTNTQPNVEIGSPKIAYGARP